MTTLSLGLFFASTASASTAGDLNSIFNNLEEQASDARANYQKTEQTNLLGEKDASTFRSKKERYDQLNYAISQRQKNDFRKQYLTPLSDKNAIAQRIRHQQSRYLKNTPERSTLVERTGELEDVPYYQFRRQFSNPSTLRSNRKQVFRQRAIDYYINQGYAGTEALQSDLIRGDQHVVNRVTSPATKTAAAQAETISAVRDQQKAQIGRPTQVPTGYQRTSRRVNSFGKTYSNPYQYSLFVE